MRNFFTTDSKIRVLILTAGFGDGHNAAARNVADAIESEGVRGQDAVESVVLDLFDLVHPHTSAVLRKVYRLGIVHFPQLWFQLYRASDNLDPKGDPLGLFTSATLGLKRFLEVNQPSATVSTYMVYPQLLERICGGHGVLPFPAFTVITDSGSINAIWRKGRTDRFFVADQPSMETMLASGVPAEKLEISGFPVSLAFESVVDQPMPDLKNPKVVYFPMTSVREVKETLGGLCKLPLQLTVVLGRHEKRLGKTVRGLLRKKEGATVLGWCDRVPELLGDHHAVVGKAGGASVQEAMAARRPLVINYIVPGQEEGNAQFLEKNRCGLVALGPDQTLAAVESLFLNNGKLLRELSENCAKLGHPGAARKIAREVLASCHRG